MRIIHATDFSTASEVAFAHALALALVHEAELTLLHVGTVEGDAFDWRRFPGVRPRLAAWGLLREGADKHAVAAELGVEVRKAVFDGRDPVRTLFERIDADAPDLLVLASRGPQRQWELLRRSVSEALARAAVVPTLVVPEGARGFVSFADGGLHLARVLVGVDREPDPRGAVARAAALVGGLADDGVEVELCHVGAEGDAPDIADAELPGARLRRLTRTGEPGEVIAARAREIEADLIVLATAGRAGVGDALRGSVTERVLARATAPLLAVPAA